ncbi:aldehyde dehydrogenase [Phenylobacterium sp. Root700]|uniref:aldehyde dehydrogenase family protein n=1 Tax=Phenylobacterium sp. Root700 TaxID=1736591 RepID=UPI0006FC2EC9|nr:aldehyde dehydrogenase family protein [Phenylobacterium sp. Root700]KRB49629.1 hypothetical protein ASE02_17635 [Phenylobacterium sp. Root700]
MTALCNDLTTLSRINSDFISRDRQMLIGGAWVDSSAGATFAVRDPSSGKELTRVQKASVQDVDAAVVAARKALEGKAWGEARPAERERLLLRLADLLEKHADDIAELESLDNGKPISQATGLDVPLSVNFVRYMAGFATKIHGRTFDVSVPYAPDTRFFAYTRREPVGVVGAIIPWNMPLLMAVWKLAPALAAGCTVILKPASDTPLTALRIGELVLEAGFPEGVVNVITGAGGEIGDAMVSHPGIDKIAFTGSTSVGKAIARSGVDTMKRISLELGGKSPVIVLDDADLAATIPGIILGIFANCGQVCSAGSRLYIQRGIYDRLMAALGDAAKSIKVGPGLDPATQMGPMVSAGQQRSVQAYIEAGVAEGAELVVGGGQLASEGFYVSPTIFANTDHSMSIVREEIFGPVLAVQCFDDEAEAVKLANDTPYGLASSIYSTNVNRIQRLTPAIKAGTVWVNCHNIFDAALPFGGYKESGIGREMGEEAVGLYSEIKSVCMAVG